MTHCLLLASACIARNTERAGRFGQAVGLVGEGRGRASRQPHTRRNRRGRGVLRSMFAVLTHHCLPSVLAIHRRTISIAMTACATARRCAVWAAVAASGDLCAATSLAGASLTWLSQAIVLAIATSILSRSCACLQVDVRGAWLRAAGASRPQATPQIPRGLLVSALLFLFSFSHFDVRRPRTRRRVALVL